VALDAPLEKQISIAANTTIAVVGTDVALTKAQARRVAIMAQDGFARAIRPVHTPFDGDVVFVLSTGKRRLKNNVMLSRIGSMAADCLARAIARGVYEAATLGEWRCYRDVFGKAGSKTT
jgi:L-aminopeptidase/D-esterase-like protein